MEKGLSKRIQSLKKTSLNTKPSLSIERGLIVKEVYERWEGKVETPVLRALVFKSIMENKKISIAPGELLVGEKGEGPQVAPVFPELTCYRGEDFEVLKNRKEVSFQSKEDEVERYLTEIVPFFEERCARTRIFNVMSDEWKNCYQAGIFTEFMEQRGPGHTVGDGKIYREGFLDRKEKIKRVLENLDEARDPKAYEKKTRLKAMELVCDGVIAFGERYEKLAVALAEKEKNETRKKELLEIARTCSVVPKRAPQNFYQALQMYWFVHIGVTSELNVWDSFSPGRLDQHLFPFYKNDLDKGLSTRDFAEELLQCLWIKFHNQPAPPKVGVTMKESSTYTDFANINTGGVTEDGRDGVNELSYLILDVMDKMKLVQPNSNVQISVKNPPSFLLKACEISGKGWGQPAFYNTEAIIQELLNAGKSLDDARQGGASGCVETGAFGKEAYILTGYFNLSKVLEITLNNGYDPVTKMKLGVESGDPLEFSSFDELFEAFKKQLKRFVDIKIKGNHVIENIYGRHMPVPFLSTVIDDCILKAMDYNEGGARYNVNYIQGVGIGDVADSLSVLKHHVFERRTFGMNEILQAMKADFQGYEKIFQEVKNRSPLYGNDDDYADDIMKRVFNAFYNEVTGRPNGKGGTYRIDMLPTTCHVYFGSVTGASPNGRLKGTPLPDGVSPSKGADKKGPTAVMKSVAKMDHLKTGGTLLNQKFSPQSFQNDEDLNKMAALIRGFFRMDAHHVQFNVIDKQTLVDAQNKPEEYSDLIVRVAGYSDYFNNLSKELQDEIIARTEMNF